MLASDMCLYDIEISPVETEIEISGLKIESLHRFGGHVGRCVCSRYPLQAVSSFQSAA